MKGSGNVSFFISPTPKCFFTKYNMTQAQQQVITAQIAELLQSKPHLFLANIQVDVNNNITVQLDGDTGVLISDCVQLSRALYAYIEENNVFENNDFGLEVSSFGVDESLLLPRQYIKNIGRSLSIITNNEVAYTGKITAATNDWVSLIITEGKGKKSTTEEKTFNIPELTTAIVQVSFKD